MSKETSLTNHLLFMNNLKLYGRSERQLPSLVNIVRIISTDTGMKFGMDKSKMMPNRWHKMIEIDNIQMPDGERMKQVEEDRYKYLNMIQHCSQKREDREGILSLSTKNF